MLAVEGTDAYFDLLKDNTNHLGDISLEKIFLGSGVQDGGLDVQCCNGTAALTKGTSSIMTVTLDELMLNYKNVKVALLKTDTDAYDAKVLAGSSKLLTNQAPIVFTELDDFLLKQQGDSYESLLGLLSTANYGYVAVWNNDGRWLGARDIRKGLADLVASHPGGYGRPYLDIAAFTEADRVVLDELESSV